MNCCEEEDPSGSYQGPTGGDMNHGSLEHYQFTFVKVEDVEFNNVKGDISDTSSPNQQPALEDCIDRNIDSKTKPIDGLMELELPFVSTVNNKLESQVEDLDKDPLGFSPKNESTFVCYDVVKKDSDVKPRVEKPFGSYGDVGDESLVYAKVKVEESEYNIEDVISNATSSNQQQTLGERLYRNPESEKADTTLNNNSNGTGNFFRNDSMVNIHNRINEIEDTKLIFNCSRCSYNTIKKSNLLVHTRTHIKDKPLACSQCSFKTTSHSSLVAHTRTHSNEKPFACGQCSYRTVWRGNLVTHMKTHTNDKPFACCQCSYKSAQRSYLVTHIRTHTNEKAFACSQCSYRSAQRSCLVAHIRTHTNEKPFACSQCSYRVTRRSDLVIHMETHTNEKPYACNKCSYSSVWRSDLVIHMRTHNN